MNIEEMYLKRSALDLRELPDEPEPGLNEMATEMAAGTEPPGAQPMSVKEFVTTAADVPAGLLKGSVQGTAGIFGDIVSIGRGIAAAINPTEGESRADAFVRGMEMSTGLPTTEDVQQFLDSVLGPVVPAGVTDERRREAAKTAESVGEFIGAGKAVKETAQAGLKAAKEVASTPPRWSIQLAPDLEVEIAPAERSKNFKSWFGNSKVVDKTGKPLVMYHGTSESFEKFEPGTRKAIFVTSDPKFASGYATKRIDNFVDPNTGKKINLAPNIMPLYVKAVNPFDYENPKHIDAVMNRVVMEKRPKGWGDIDKQNLRDNLELGRWGFIEDQNVQKAIKELGFDSFYVKEQGVKNLGVFDPKQLKSAIGNKGTFDPNDPRITRGAIGAPVAPAAMQDEENK